MKNLSTLLLTLPEELVNLIILLAFDRRGYKIRRYTIWKKRQYGPFNRVMLELNHYFNASLYYYRPNSNIYSSGTWLGRKKPDLSIIKNGGFYGKHENFFNYMKKFGQQMWPWREFKHTYPLAGKFVEAKNEKKLSKKDMAKLAELILLKFEWNGRLEHYIQPCPIFNKAKLSIKPAPYHIDYHFNNISPKKCIYPDNFKKCHNFLFG
jgi:hypothetical protein